MAINIKQQPGLHQPVYNPIVFVLESSNVSQPNFKFIADVFISGSSDTFRMLVDPDPNYSEGVVDIHRIIESYVNPNGVEDIAKASPGFHIATNSLVTYEVKFGEQYGVASAVTDYPQLSMSGVLYANNGVYSQSDWLSYVATNTPIETGKACLSTMSKDQYSLMSSPNGFFLHYITNTSGSVYFAEIKTYDSSGSLIKTIRISNAFQAVGNDARRRIYVSLGAVDLNSASLYSGSQPVIDSSVEYYTIQLTNWAGTGLLATPYTVHRDNNCTNGRVCYPIFFRNKLGGFDTFEFTMKNRYKKPIERKKFERNIGTHSNDTWSYNSHDSGTVQIDTSITKQIVLVSNWLSNNDNEMLNELIESPVIFLYDGTTMFRATVINPASTDEKSINEDLLFNTTITIELSMKEWRQRG